MNPVRPTPPNPNALAARIATIETTIKDIYVELREVRRTGHQVLALLMRSHQLDTDGSIDMRPKRKRRAQ